LTKKKNREIPKSSVDTRKASLYRSSKAALLYRMILLILPFLLYANTLHHQYALDDDIVIRKNEFVQKGVSGIYDILAQETFTGFFGKKKDLVAGGRYRPLSLVTFALEHEFFGERPALSHFINILLYAITALLIFAFLNLLLIKSKHWNSWAPALPFLAALLWAIHPIHTEVVANIKGRDEIMAMLFSVLATLSYLRFYDSGKTRWMTLSLFSLFLAMLSKENAFTFVLLIPLAVWFFRTASPKILLRDISLMLIPAVMVLLLRYNALHGMELSGESVNELMNNPFVGAGFARKYATIIFTLGKYLQLLLLPITLTHDYYPYHISLRTFSDPYVIASALIYLAMIFYALFSFLRKRDIPGFAIAFYLITLSVVSNIFFPVGTFMAERLVFMPSLGIMLLFAWGIVKLGMLLSKANHAPPRGAFWNWMFEKNKAGLLIFLAMLAGYSFKTVDRNPVWKNNESLFLSDIHISKNSAKMNNAAAGMLYDMSQRENITPGQKRKYLSRAKGYAEKAVEIYPGYRAAWQTLGNIYYFLDHDIDKALRAYENAGTPEAYRNMLAIGQRAMKNGDYAGAEKCFGMYIAKKPNYSIGYLELADVYLKEGDAKTAIRVLEDALTKFKNNSEILNKLGLAYGQGLEDFDKAIRYFELALEANPKNAEAMENMGVAYGFLGENEKSIRFFKQALKYKKNDYRLYQNIANAYFRLGEVKRAKEYVIKAEQYARQKNKEVE